ncbi:unnamed protein product [Phytophthora fragariaefolia]|uniref:Unnamed protein product n=1 Tax=Phytophthora fragariaefolia TaxID=1490495 RepID=A0A9W6WRR0_9STRA|nr:unnamed protein product [Phytophthora fragariaefolia]GMF19370.1 unnamed protein product [Phytophthora fragariaefolia]
MFNSVKILATCIAGVALSSGVYASKEVTEGLVGGPVGVSVGVPGIASVNVGPGAYGPGVVGPGVNVGVPGIVGVGVGPTVGYDSMSAVAPPGNAGGASANANANAGRKLRSDQ